MHWLDVSAERWILVKHALNLNVIKVHEIKLNLIQCGQSRGSAVTF